MNTCKTEFVILGSGFGGSLLALILARAGKSVVMVDRSRHPKFAIGESSTPLADRTLAQMSDEYGIPELRLLCHWGSWKRGLPQLMCGKKRGFTYFDQTTGEEMTAENIDARRLLVSASIDDEHSDTHWLRSDVDHFVFQLAKDAGVLAFEQCQYTLSQQDAQWTLEGSAAGRLTRLEEEAPLSLASSLSRVKQDRTRERLNQPPAAIHRPNFASGQESIRIEASFLIDATGSSNGVLKFLNIPDQTHVLKTNSRSIFAHFESAVTCEQLLRSRSIDVETFPYHCDDAAVHQVLPDGWMWQLRFDDDTLSAGFMIDERPDADHVSATFATPQEEWDWRIARSPFLSRQFENARIVRPESGLHSTKRIQRLAGQGAGDNWAAIANTVGFIDPLHSTGIAHTLFSVSRLADILLSGSNLATRAKQLQEYSNNLITELQFVDELVEGCYEAIPSFPLWCQWGMLYFAAATSMEQLPADKIGDVSFLRANDVTFREMLREARQRLGDARRTSIGDRVSGEANFEAWLKSAVAPWNQVGLFDDSCNNLYSQTAAPADAW